MNNMSDKYYNSMQEKFETQRMMENYHWISIKSFWHDTPENDQVLEEILKQKHKINKMLNDFQISLMEASKNRQKLHHVMLFTSNQ